MQWQTYVERHPASALAAAALIGVMTGRRLARRFAAEDPAAGYGDLGYGPGPPAPGPEYRLAAPARPAAARPDYMASVSASWARLGSRAEALVNRLIDEVADAAERAVVPALVGGIQAVLERRPARPVNRSVPGEGRPSAPAERSVA
jgi:hypothetical protein